MTSTSDRADHFKEDSLETVHQYQLFTHNKPRQNRLPGRENASSLSFGSSFGVGTNLWSNTSNIWRPKNRFLDGSPEEGMDSHHQSSNPVADRSTEPQANNQSGTSTPSKSGSKSLLPSSESELPLIRKNVPWGTSISTTNLLNPRPQNQVISPLRQQHLDALTASQRVGLNSRPGTSRVSPTSGEYQPFNDPLTQIGNDFRHPLDLSVVADHLPSIDTRQAITSNLAAFQTNRISNSTLQHQAGSNGHYDTRLYGKHNDGSMGFSAYDEPSAGNAFRYLPSKSEFNCETLSSGHRLRPHTNSNMDTCDKANPSHQSSHSSQGQVSGVQSSYQTQTTTPQAQEFRDARMNAPFSLQSDSFQSYGSHYFTPYSRSSSYGDTTVATPASDYKRSLNSPFCSSSSTPPTGPESYRTGVNSGASSRGSHTYSQSYERGLYRDFPTVSLNPLNTFNSSYANTHELAGYPGAMRMNPLAHPYTMPGYVNMSALPSAPRFQPREIEHSHVARSSVLEDFRMNNKTNKRFELRDIYDHVVEFSGDQHGSRFIQLKLETANSDEKDQIFSEIKSNSLQLMTDLFGNYVIQKFFEHGNQAQKKLLANQMKGHVLSLSTQMYGCRVVQKALEHVLTDQQASIVKELENHVLKCVKDQNGNHVIQKAIERVPAEHIQFIIAAFTDQVQRLATHPYGCRVIQRMLEHCEEPAKKSILKELYSCIPRLITDQFGNYVIQHVIENGEAEDRHNIVAIVLSQLLVFSKHKYASNVVEKSIEFAQEDQRSEILRRLTGQDENGESPVLSLMRDQYGNYVIQKILGQLKGQEWEALVNQIKPLMPQLKRFSHGKQIIAIEKLILDDPTTSNSLSTSSQSSSLPSTNASTVEGPVNSSNLPDTNKLHETQIALPFAMGSIRT